MSVVGKRADAPQAQAQAWRRAQNQGAQRAYRERKEQLRGEPEAHVERWQRKYQVLREWFVDQAQDIQRLKNHVDMLQTQLLAIQCILLRDDRTLYDFDM